MTSFLLDTNVVSELVKRRPDPRVLRWLQERPLAHLSVLTIGELSRGAWKLRAKDPERSARLEAWIRDLEVGFGETLLPVDADVVRVWAHLPVQRTLPVVDSLLSATALHHDLVIATRNVKDFDDTGARVFNPFDG